MTCFFSTSHDFFISCSSLFCCFAFGFSNDQKENVSYVVKDADVNSARVSKCPDEKNHCFPLSFCPTAAVVWLGVGDITRLHVKTLQTLFVSEIYVTCAYQKTFCPAGLFYVRHVARLDIDVTFRYPLWQLTRVCEPHCF